MYDPRELLRRSPSEIATSVTVLLNVAVLTGLLEISKDAVAGVNIAVATVLGLFYVKSQTVSTAKLAEVKSAQDDAFMFGATVAAPLVGQADSVNVSGTDVSVAPTQMDKGAKNKQSGQVSLPVLLVILAVICAIVGIWSAAKFLIIVAAVIVVVALVVNGRTRV